MLMLLTLAPSSLFIFGAKLAIILFCINRSNKELFFKTGTLVSFSYYRSYFEHFPS